MVQETLIFTASNVRRRSYLRGGIVLLGLLLSSLLGLAQAGSTPSDLSPRPNGGWGAIWSLRGDQLAFLSSQGGLPAELWVCDRSGKTFRRLTSGGADEPAWSPDGSYLTYTTVRSGRSERWRVDVSDGHASLELSPACVPPQAPRSASPDGRTIAYLLSEAKSLDLYLTDSADQTPRRVTSGFTVGSFSWSPQGDKIAFGAVNRLSHGLPQVWVYDLGQKKLAHVGAAGSFDPIWSAKGDLLAYTMMYPKKGYCVAITSPANPKGLLVKDLVYQGDGMAWSPVTDLLAVIMSKDDQSQVWLVDGKGGVQSRISKRDLRIRFPSWSADGRCLALEAMLKGSSAASEVWMVDARGKRWTNLTPSRASAWGMTSTDDGRLIFLSNRGGAVQAWRLDSRAKAAGAPRPIPGSKGASRISASSDGARYAVLRPGTVTVVSQDGKAQGTLSLSGMNPAEARWSPQGDRLAVGLPGGAGEEAIKIVSVAADGKLAEVASLSGRNPTWGQGGDSLLFARDNQIWKASKDGKDSTVWATVAAEEGEQVLASSPTWDSAGQTLAFVVTRISPKAWRQELQLLRAGQTSVICSEPVTTEFGLSPQRYSSPPAWLPDGRLLFTSDRAGTPQVWSIRSDGSDLWTLTPEDSVWPVCSSDGSSVYFVRPDDASLLWKVTADGSQLAPLRWKQ